MKKLIILFVAIIALSWAWQAEARTINWSPPTSYTGGAPLPDAEIDHYNLYCGTASGVYTIPINAGKVTSYVIDDDLPRDNKLTDYYCVATTITINGKESAYSNETSFPFDTREAAVPIDDLATTE